MGSDIPDITSVGIGLKYFCKVAKSFSFIFQGCTRIVSPASCWTPRYRTQPSTVHCQIWAGGGLGRTLAFDFLAAGFFVELLAVTFFVPLVAIN